MSDSGDSATLTIWNVLFAAAFVVLASVLSFALGLGIESTILVAGSRCWIQLTLVGFILNDVFESRNPWLVAFMTIILTLLGTFEAVFQRSKKTYKGIYPVVLSSLFASLVVALLGVRFAISKRPGTSWWDPVQLIPITGMLIGNAVSGVAVGVGFVLNQVIDNQDKIEMYLAFGASRFEAMQPILIEAVRTAVVPSVTSMSVVGLISIPGMMTGSILGGASVTQAAMYQEIILYLISASNLISVFASVCMTTFLVCIDTSHRLRGDRIEQKKPLRIFPPGNLLSREWSKVTTRWRGRARAATLGDDELPSPLRPLTRGSVVSV